MEVTPGTCLAHTPGSHADTAMKPSICASLALTAQFIVTIADSGSALTVRDAILLAPGTQGAAWLGYLDGWLDSPDDADYNDELLPLVAEVLSSEEPHTVFLPVYYGEIGRDFNGGASIEVCAAMSTGAWIRLISR